MQLSRRPGSGRSEEWWLPSGFQLLQLQRCFDSAAPSAPSAHQRPSFVIGFRSRQKVPSREILRHGALRKVVAFMAGCWL